MRNSKDTKYSSIVDFVVDVDIDSKAFFGGHDKLY
jgi:hypothetical protein